MAGVCSGVRAGASPQQSHAFRFIFFSNSERLYSIDSGAVDVDERRRYRAGRHGRPNRDQRHLRRLRRQGRKAGVVYDRSGQREHLLQREQKGLYNERRACTARLIH